MTLLFLLVAPLARAEISIDSSEYLVEVFAGVDQNGDRVILDDEADIDEVARSGGLSFSESLRASTPSSSSSASQTSSVSAAGARVQIASSGTCRGRSDQGGESTQAYGNAILGLQLTLTLPTRLSVTGTLAASENARAVLNASGTPSIAHEIVDATETVSENQVLPPGTHFISVLCSADTYFDVGFGGFETADSRWNLAVTLIEGEDECADELLTWVGGRDGAFDLAQNWEPPTVPLFEENGRCDSILVRGGSDVTIDLDAAPAPALAGAARAAAAPTPVRRVSRLIVDKTRGLRPVDGTLALDALGSALGERSLEVQNGAVLRLDGGAVLARHVALGALGDGSIEVVGTRGLLQTDGRLGLGLLGSGNLLVADGATVIAAEAVLGEESAQGSATVQGSASFLETGSIAVGLEDDGALVIEAGGQASSDTGVIAFNLDGDERGNARVRGSDAAGTRSKWTLTSLDVRPLGSLDIEQGAQVEISGPLSIGAEGAAADCVDGRACVWIFDGQLEADGVTVGDGGEGALWVDSNGSLATAGVFAIRQGEVRLSGARDDASLISDLQVATGAGEFGTLEIGTFENRASGQLDLLGRFRLGGGANALGTLGIFGDVDDPEATRVVCLDATGADSIVGGARGSTQRRGGQLQLESALLDLAGAGHDLVIEPTGLVNGSGGRISLEAGSKLVNRGELVGDFVIEGDYVQAPGAILNANLLVTPGVAPAQSALAAEQQTLARAAAAPPPFMPVIVTGNATLAGTAKLQFGNGVAPKQGDRFQLLKVQGETTGAFDAVEIAGLVPGSFDFDVATENGALVLTSLTDAQPLPYVDIAGKPLLLERKKAAKLKLTRTGDAREPLTVAYTVGGSAESGVDFVALPGSITFPAKKKSVKLMVQPIADALAEGRETIEIELAPNASFAPGLVSRFTIELRDGKQKK